MSQIAFLWNNIYIYWSGIIIGLAVLASILTAIGLRLLQEHRALDMVVLAPIAVLFSFFACRFLHWYCFYRQYEGIAEAFTDYSVGAFSLPGAFLGVFAAALVIRLTKLADSLPRLLDAIVPAAALGIGAGRFSAMFNSYDRGTVIVASESLRHFPIATEVSGEWHTAVFAWEGIAAFIIAAVLIVLFLSECTGKSRLRDGQIFWLFLLLYGSAEVLLDSMRYDSAFFRSNGFVSVVQIIGLVTLIVEVVLFSVRAIRAEGFRRRFILFWVQFLAGTGAAGFCEYYVQRHGDLYLFCYTLMGAGLILAVSAVIALMCRSNAPVPRFISTVSETPSGLPDAAEDTPMEDTSGNTIHARTTYRKTVRRWKNVR